MNKRKPDDSPESIFLKTNCNKKPNINETDFVIVNNISEDINSLTI